jgi:hypothetical protein
VFVHVAEEHGSGQHGPHFSCTHAEASPVGRAPLYTCNGLIVRGREGEEPRGGGGLLACV